MSPPIAIVGGGPAGLALAACLTQRGIDYIVYERSSDGSKPYGGCLDLHVGSGQRAMREGGVFDEFKKSSRDGDATIHLVYDHHGKHLFSWGEGRDSPEIDRWQLRRVLLTGIPKEKVVWSKALKSADRDENGKIVLKFEDGTTESGFQLVVGADGSASKIRHLVTTAKPVYSGKTYITTKIHPGNPYYEKMKSICKMGSMVAMGKGKHMFNSRQGDGHYRIDLGIEVPVDWTTSGHVDLSNFDEAKKFFLQESFYGAYSPELKDIIQYSEGPFRPWIMYHMPTDELNWSPCADVTLIGDAAHVTIPLVGDGVNCAMRDSVILADMIKQYGLTQKAITEYEKEMFPYAIDVITRSNASGKLFFGESAEPFIQMMTQSPLIGVADHH
ncbi:hypothetical protein SBRCBS47491_010022 [Sporothrix bragantina]|uniref:FAD-binding domain-containing protein n=1 Tax=Sporothrix bragantina TaxID=671064 RepID=A0ABP0D047_9PEZI